MKITGYTIIYFLLSMLLLWGFVEFELWFYEKTINNFNFITINLLFFIFIIVILGAFGYLNKIDKLLKKRIL